MQVSGSPRHIVRMSYFAIHARRRSPQYCDTNALHGYFKAPIDAFRYVSVIEDDEKKHFRRLYAEQDRGEYAVLVRIERQVPEPAG